MSSLYDRLTHLDTEFDEWKKKMNDQQNIMSHVQELKNYAINEGRTLGLSDEDIKEMIIKKMEKFGSTQYIEGLMKLGREYFSENDSKYLVLESVDSYSNSPHKIGMLRGRLLQIAEDEKNKTLSLNPDS